MVQIDVQADCGNAPKKEFIRDFEIAFAQNNKELVLDSMDEHIVWEMIGENIIVGKESMTEELEGMLDDTVATLTIENIMTHGDVGAANGTMLFRDGTEYGFCDIFTFTSHAKDAKIKKLQAYVVEIKAK